MPIDPWRRWLIFFSYGSVVNSPSSTYLWLKARRCRYRLIISLQLWCIVVAVCLDNCFIRLPWLSAILRAIWPNSMMKSSRLSFGDLISACWGSLFNLIIWRVLTFKIFHHIKTLFMKMTVSFLFAFILDRVRNIFSENILRQVETRCLSVGFEAMEISFKSESLTCILDSNRYNCLRCAHFATCFTPASSKINSVSSEYSPPIANI